MERYKGLSVTTRAGEEIEGSKEIIKGVIPITIGSVVCIGSLYFPIRTLGTSVDNV
jgi:hypothetical protein